jgi:formylglycine-generating enzyme required for sulfatase activity
MKKVNGDCREMVVKTIKNAVMLLTIAFIVSGCVTAGKNKIPIPEIPVPKMVKINGGNFMMGTPDDEVGRENNEGPRHEVTLRTFCMSKYEITQKEFQAVMGFNPAAYFAPDLPVDYISWYDAINYCNALSKLEGLKSAYTVTQTEKGTDVQWDRSANGYRLPTEAEWEYACRAGTEIPWNVRTTINTADPASVLFANYDMDYFDKKFNYNFTPGNLIIGGSFPPNANGLYDMHGNVYEWCWDLWANHYPNQPQDNPVGPDVPNVNFDRVLRSGCYFVKSWAIRSGKRDNSGPIVRWRGNGIRLVKNDE